MQSAVGISLTKLETEFNEGKIEQENKRFNRQLNLNTNQLRIGTAEDGGGV
jgi:hypothetical protein